MSPSTAEALQLTVVETSLKIDTTVPRACRLCFCAIYTTEFATRPCCHASVKFDLLRIVHRLQRAFCLLAKVLKLCFLGFGVYFCGQARNRSGFAMGTLARLSLGENAHT